MLGKGSMHVTSTRHMTRPRRRLWRRQKQCWLLRIRTPLQIGIQHAIYGCGGRSSGSAATAGVAGSSDGSGGNQRLAGVTRMEIKGAGVQPNRYYTLDECLRMDGVRYTAVPECPAPISEPLKQLLWVRRIPAARVVHPSHPSIGLAFLDDAGGSELLQRTTAQTSWPVLFYGRDRPRTAWLEQLELVERLGAAGTPNLIPSDPSDHARMVGMIHLIMGEGGFFWMRRLLHISARCEKSIR